MGILSKMDAEVRKLVRGGTRTGFSTNRTRVVHTNPKTKQLFQDFPVKLRNQVLRKGVRASGTVVVKAAREELSGKRSSVTGSREFWAPDTKARREGMWDLYKSIGVKVKNYRATKPDGAIVALAGPRFPSGNHGHLIELGGFHPYWGRKDGEFEPPFPFLRRSTERTQSKQVQVLESKVKQEWLKV